MSKSQEVERFVKQLLNIVAKSIGRPVDSGCPVHREALWHMLKYGKNRVDDTALGGMKRRHN